MLILGIDTATSRAGVALAGQDGLLASVAVGRPRRHLESVVPSVKFACELAGVALGDVAAIAVDIGPGLFSGLRVGMATAKALAHALRIPTVGVASLDLVAFPLRHTSRLIVPAIDARRGEVYWALYRQVPGGVQRQGDYQLTSPEELASELLALGEECLLAGDGAERYRSVLVDPFSFELAGSLHSCPSAEALVDLARPRALREEFVAFWDLKPLYLRRSDAEINWAADPHARSTRRSVTDRRAQ
ncbi:MAG: tRNA (adenosine(37)-N6)-threonylcarbamoyltransferase complex dimerization subunit type 1 TsaB [Acidimicrobiales bacterium]